MGTHQQYQLFYEEQFGDRDVITEFLLLRDEEAEMLQSRMDALADLGVIGYPSLTKLTDASFRNFAQATAIFDEATLRRAGLPPL